MAYSILLTNREGKMKDIPFSTASTFNSYWHLIMQKQKLEILFNIEYGYEVSKDEFSLLILDLEKVRTIESNPKGINDRLDYIINQLKSIKIDSCSYVYLG